MTYKTTPDASQLTWLEPHETGPHVWFQGAWYGIDGGDVVRGGDNNWVANPVEIFANGGLRGLHLMNVPTIAGGPVASRRAFVAAR